MEDYKQEIRNLILAYYWAKGIGNKVYKTTQELLQMCQGVIPHQPITQHDVYEVMKEMGFSIEQVSITEKQMIFEGDEEKGIPPKYDDVETAREFRWVLYENPSSHTIKITP